MSKYLKKRRSRRGSELSEEGTKRDKEYGSVTSLVNNEWEVKYTVKQLLPQQSSEEDAAPLTVSRGKEDTSTFFKDQKRKIDFVLVFEEDKKDAVLGLLPKELEGTDIGVAAAAQAFKKLGKKKQRFRLWRQKFLAGLNTVGLDSEEEVNSDGNKTNVHFIKLHAPWPLLCRFAEELNLRAPLQAHPNPSGNWSEWLLAKLHIPNLLAEEVPNKPLDYYTCPFKMSKLDRFLGSEDITNFFSRAQRSRIVYEILCTTAFGREKKGEVGVSTLVENGAFTAAFPLHDGTYRYPGPATPHHLLNARQVLHEFWARWGKWYKYQPLDHIRDYFGERIAIYFAWLGFYTGWLLPAALVGLAVFLYGLCTLDQNVSAQEVCGEKARNVTMCPLCANCTTWPLHQICDYTRIAYLFDHPGTVFYAVFMSFWAVTFLEYWKRKNASLAHHWDCMGFQDEEERPRPEFAAKAPYLEKNPITGVREPAFPKAVRMRRIAAGSGLIILMILLVLIFIIAVVIYRTVASIYLFNNEHTSKFAPILASSSGAMINLMAIMAMGRLYEHMAERLTIWEMHRTQSDFDDNLTFKVFIFQFINFYSSIIYIAFFKGKFVGYPGHYKNIVGNLRNEDCGNGGCLIELAQQLAVIMIGKQVINNAQEIIIPKVQAWWQNQKHLGSKTGGIGSSQIEEDYRLVDNEGLFQEYLEMVLQFGFITIFVAAFPLAPLFALLNNWVEIRLDAQKFVRETRRAVAERAENIGIWFKILEMLAQLAVISNAFLIAFTSDFIQKLVYKYEYGERGIMRGYVMFTLSKSPVKNWMDKEQPECYYRGFRDDTGTFTPVHWKILALKFAFVIIFEHVVFGVCKLIDVIVPDIPESLDIKVKRERYLAKEALQDAEHVLQKVLTDREDEVGASDAERGSPVLRKGRSQEQREGSTLRLHSQLSGSQSASQNHLSSSQNHLAGSQNQNNYSSTSATSATAQACPSPNSQLKPLLPSPLPSQPASGLSLQPLAHQCATPLLTPQPSDYQPSNSQETQFGVGAPPVRLPPPTRPRRLQRGTTIPTPPTPSRAPSLAARAPSLGARAPPPFPARRNPPAL